MKNIFKLIAVFMLPLLVVTSCVDDDKLFELNDFENGAIPNLTQTANDDGFIDLTNLDNVVMEFTVDLAVNFEQSDDGGITTGGSGRENTSLEWAEVSSLDLEVSYINAVSGKIDQGVIGNISSWPVTMTLSTSDLIDAIPSLNSNADINLTDQFVFVTGVNLASGKTLPAFVKDPMGNPVPGYSVNFNGAGNNPGINFSIAYNVSCVSELDFPTVYDVSTNVTGTCCGLPTGVHPTNTTAIITRVGVASYEISDALGWHLAPFFGQVDEPLIVIDVCNEITVDAVNCSATSTLCYLPNTLDPTGSYDPVTDTWVIKWEDAFGNGIRGITTLTPQ